MTNAGIMMEIVCFISRVSSEIKCICSIWICDALFRIESSLDLCNADPSAYRLNRNYFKVDGNITRIVQCLMQKNTITIYKISNLENCLFLSKNGTI